VERAAASIVASKSYDNGIVCASEHNLVVDAAIAPRFVAALQRHGAAIVAAEDVDRFVTAVFDADTSHVRHELHGQPAARLAEIAGIAVADAVKLLVVPARADLAGGPLGFEKLAPLTSMFVVQGEEEALTLSRRLLANEGAGHTAIIHTTDYARVHRFSRSLPVGRVLVNVPGTHGSLGLGTGLRTSMTLGTGTAGGTSTTDAVTYTHLLNVKRVAYARAA
jgi:acyl-CoA reductase-like NAD-dependent aldehyde dehydrogenase